MYTCSWAILNWMNINVRHKFHVIRILLDVMKICTLPSHARKIANVKFYIATLHLQNEHTYTR